MEWKFAHSKFDFDIPLYLHHTLDCGDKSGVTVSMSKTLYGLYQSRYVWNRHIISKFEELRSRTFVWRLMHASRAGQIDEHHHFWREKMEEGEIDMLRVGSSGMMPVS